MNAKLFEEYMYQKLVEIEVAEDELFRRLRTRRGLIMMADQLRVLEIQKAYLNLLYHELKPFFEDM